ncbi:hypothetical protein GBAR_LOCUS20667 [Geodia barretti]|uniref:Uncharacterized protein n=1 Tax=Geodia barretti TaxID=519541 RepID=A0AA35X3P1_GEOBA|nr:hypothetical protein GBAR_LOCUS20667 [Geodia barretti]
MEMWRLKSAVERRESSHVVQWMCGHSPSPLTHRNQQCYRGNQR